MVQQRNGTLIKTITRRQTEIVDKVERTLVGDRCLVVCLIWDDQTFKAELLVN